MADDLTAWLGARWDERERQLADEERWARTAAELAKSAAWLSGAEGSVFGCDPASDLHVRGAVLSLDGIGVHIARQDPASTLARIELERRDIAAKRHILAEHRVNANLSSYEMQCGRGMTFGCYICHEWDGIVKGDGYCVTVRALGLPYTDHPDFREEWRL